MAAIERPDALLQQRALAVKILFRLAERAVSAGKFEQAEQYCREALQHEEGSVKVCVTYIYRCVHRTYVRTDALGLICVDTAAAGPDLHASGCVGPV